MSQALIACTSEALAKAAGPRALCGTRSPSFAGQAEQQGQWGCGSWHAAGTTPADMPDAASAHGRHPFCVPCQPGTSISCYGPPPHLPARRRDHSKPQCSAARDALPGAPHSLNCADGCTAGVCLWCYLLSPGTHTLAALGSAFGATAVARPCAASVFRVGQKPAAADAAEQQSLGGRRQRWSSPSAEGRKVTGQTSMSRLPPMGTPGLEGTCQLACREHPPRRTTACPRLRPGRQAPCLQTELGSPRRCGLHA